MKLRCALFDMDETILSCDSMFVYVRHCLKTHPGSLFSISLSFLREAARYAASGGKSLDGMKEALLLSLGFLDEPEIRSVFFDTVLQQHLYAQAAKEIRSLKEDGYYLILASASPENYTRYITEALPFDQVFATRLDASGKIIGKNCKGEEKVRRIQDFLKRQGWEIDYEHSCAYSDSYKNDLPMLNMVQRRYLINSDIRKEGFINLHWR